MIWRRLGLHGKFILSLLVAAALPFFIGLIFFEAMGYRYMIEQRGRQHQIEADALISAISQASNAEADKLRTWLASEQDLMRHLAGLAGDQALSHTEDEARMLDEIWASLPENDPKLLAILRNPVADSLRRYQRVHEAAVEILVADDKGHLLAASDKPTDYRQADEYWWQHGAELPPGEFWCDTIHYDDSAESFTIDVILPVHREGRLLGVIKMGVEVASLVPHLIMRGIQSEACWYFVLRSGHILISSDSSIEPLKRQVPSALIDEVRSRGNGWAKVLDADGKEQIIGFTAFHADNFGPNAYVVFSSLTSDLFKPLWGSFIALAIAGLSLLGLCLLVGFFLIQRKVLSPLGRIELAIRSMSALARMRRQGGGDKLLGQQQEVETCLRDIQKIRTGDQMELLAREISTMISRVLNYQAESDKSEGREVSPKPAGEDAE